MTEVTELDTPLRCVNEAENLGSSYTVLNFATQCGIYKPDYTPAMKIMVLNSYHNNFHNF